MAQLLAKRSFAGVFCATAPAANAIIRSMDNVIVFFIRSPLILQNICRESGVDRWPRCTTKSLSGVLFAGCRIVLVGFLRLLPEIIACLFGLTTHHENVAAVYHRVWARHCDIRPKPM